jgi:predicted TPR repeat methyltransferase
MTGSDPKADQYARAAEDWTDRQYANPAAWFERRADLVVSLGPRLDLDDEVLELACGDGALGDQLLARGLRYRGVDVTPEMVAAASSRLGERATAEVGDLNTYVPPAPVAATAVFRALYYIPDRSAFFRHAAEFTDRKLMFDFNPRQYAVEDVVADLHAAELRQVELRPFFVPLTFTLPRAALAVGRVLERSGPLARLILRFKFSYIVAAWR